MSERYVNMNLVGTIQAWWAVGGQPIPECWAACDGRRVFRRHEPELYRLLRPVWHERWRPWRVHIPDMRNRHAGKATWGDLIYIIRTHRSV